MTIFRNNSNGPHTLPTEAGDHLILPAKDVDGGNGFLPGCVGDSDGRRVTDYVKGLIRANGVVEVIEGEDDAYRTEGKGKKAKATEAVLPLPTVPPVVPSDASVPPVPAVPTVPPVPAVPPVPEKVEKQPAKRGRKPKAK